MTSSFEHDGVVLIEERVHERVHLFVLQGLPASHLDEFGWIGRDGLKNIRERHLLSTAVGILGIAIAAAERASRKANEDTRLPNVGGLALNGEENFGDAHGVRGIPKMAALPS